MLQCWNATVSKNDIFEPFIYIYGLFYHDRLGTNIGKRPFFLRVARRRAPSRSAPRGPAFTIWRSINKSSTTSLQRSLQSSSSSRRCGNKTPLRSHLHMIKRWIYQDRLGTSTGRVEKQATFYRGTRSSPSRRSPWLPRASARRTHRRLMAALPTAGRACGRRG